MRTFSLPLLAAALLLLLSSAGIGQLENLPHEVYRLEWPQGEHWKVGNRQENDRMLRIDMVRGQETVDNWTELVTMISHKGVQKMDVVNMMNAVHQEYLKRCMDAQLTVVEQDIEAEYPWIIFTIECGVFDNGMQGESQIWQIVQGKFALYTNYRALRVGSLSDDAVRRATSLFKTGQVTYRK